MRWRAAVRAALTLRRTSSGRRDSRGSSWFESTWTAAKLRPRLVGVARRGCRTMRRAACSSWNADDGRRGVLPAIGGWVSGHLAGFADRPVPVCESAWADSLEMPRSKIPLAEKCAVGLPLVCVQNGRWGSCRSGLSKLPPHFQERVGKEEKQSAVKSPIYPITNPIYVSDLKYFNGLSPPECP